MKKKIIILLSVAIIFALAAILLIRINEKPQNEASESIVDAVNKAAGIVATDTEERAEKERAAKEKKEKAARARKAKAKKESDLEKLRQNMSLRENIVEEFIHGDKGKEYQKYIVLHDTEGGSNADNVIAGWQNQGKKVASHFVINKDGTIVQCVPMDKIAHHAGFGNAGHNEKFAVTDESRDDKVGTESIGSDCPDYGMNSYSIGIEMIHDGQAGEVYPEAQLDALDKLIQYIDAYYGSESTIIDHKMWRQGNSDTSQEFAGYLENYRSGRKHN